MTQPLGNYHLGIDIGTSTTAAAAHAAGEVETVQLGEHGPTVPSVLYLRPEGDLVAGDGAERRALAEPGRVAREVKRRLGDPTPMVIGGVTATPEVLTGNLLRWVHAAVVRRRGGAPAAVALTHPANWGTYKLDLLAQAADVAGLGEVAMVSEPEAAAISYASQERVAPGAVVAVYDLGGGTFDAAVLRKLDDGGGFAVLGSPEGIERLGGVDVDAAVFEYVNGALDGSLDDLDPDDAEAVTAVARLRRECTQAKEALSADDEVTIPVVLPTRHAEVRLRRGELEERIRPLLADSVTALRRALRSAGVGPDDVDHVLLVGGSSRIPLVRQLVGEGLGRPVALDAHPKHAVALGAAQVAAHAVGVPLTDAAQLSTGPTPAVAAPSAFPVAPPPPAAPPAPAAPAAPMAAAPTTGEVGILPDPSFDAAADEAPAPSLGYRAASSPPAPGTAREAPAAPAPGTPSAPPAPQSLPPGYLTPEQKAKRRKRQRLRERLAAGVGTLLAVAGIGLTARMWLSQNDPTTLADVETGDCFTGDAGDLTVVGCDEPHDREVIGTVLADDPEGAYPGTGELREAGDDGCADELTGYYGAGVEVAAVQGVDVTAIVPTEDQWNDGRTGTICVAHAAESGRRTRGSVRDAGSGSGSDSGSDADSSSDSGSD